jgi:ribonuclease P protein subunit RPR2
VTIAEERVDALATLARETAASDPSLAKRYVRLARRVAERNRIQLPRRFRRYTCDACDAYMRPGETARVRLRNGHIVIACECGEIERIPYRDES